MHMKWHTPMINPSNNQKLCRHHRYQTRLRHVFNLIQSLPSLPRSRPLHIKACPLRACLRRLCEAPNPAGTHFPFSHFHHSHSRTRLASPSSPPLPKESRSLSTTLRPRTAPARCVNSTAHNHRPVIATRKAAAHRAPPRGRRRGHTRNQS